MDSNKLPGMFDLSGKVALVTGGHSGLGKAIAEGLAGAGANTVIAARRFDVCQQVAAEIEKKTGSRSLPVRCDVARTEDAEAAVAAAVSTFGRLDILVNSAGTGGSEKPVAEMTDDDWDTTLNTNLRGTFVCSRAATKVMIKQGNGGKIINLASMMAIIAARNLADYCASKGGVVQLTRAMALELGRHNIQVNVVCPGYFLTPMNAEFFATEAGKEMIKRNMPLRRLGDPDEIKGIAVYLASPASSFTTGASIVVDGGQTVW